MNQKYSCSSDMKNLMEKCASYNKFSPYLFLISFFYLLTCFSIILDNSIKYYDYNWNQTLFDIVYVICFIWEVTFGIIAKMLNKNGSMVQASEVYQVASCGTFIVSLLLVFGSEGVFRFSSGVYLTITLIIDVYIHKLRKEKQQKNAEISKRMDKNYIVLEENNVKGFMFVDICNSSDGFYFSIAYKDIKCLCTYSFSPNINRYYNLVIAHTKGVCLLSVENAKNIATYIYRAMCNDEAGQDKSEVEKASAAINTEIENSNEKRSIPLVPSKNAEGMIVCPSCATVQNTNRYKCFHCGQEFVNGQPGIPYWCGNCGEKGPYDKVCPKCQSSLKIHNRTL